MVRKYANNEDIILTSKRMFPDKQNMPDPNETLNRYRRGKIQGKNNNRQSLGLPTPTVRLEVEKKPKLIREVEERKFMEEMYNSCQRCGKDISNDKVFSPLTYSYGLCPPCNTDLERSVRG